MSQKFLSVLCLACALLLVSTGCRTKATSGRANTLLAADENTPVIVEINGSPERQASFERFVKSRLSDISQQQSQQEADKLRSGLLDEFIRRQLIVREAQKKGIFATEEEVRREIQAQHQQTTADGANQDQTALAGIERTAEIESDLLTIKYYQSEVYKDVKVTPEEVKKFYQENPSLYHAESGFCVREIRVADAKEAELLRKQALDKPADFPTLAREHSQSPTAVKSGLTCYEAKQLPPVLEDAILGLKVGSISPVVKSNYGYHIFKLEKRAEAQPFEKISKQIEDDLMRTKNQGVIDAYNEQALKAARINIYYDRLGFNYTGNLKTAAK